MIRLLNRDLQYSLAERENFILNLKKMPEKYVLLQTCNRVELYMGEGDADHKISNHLFRVVSGLESALIGETAIQGQVKQAYLKSINEKKISRGLHQLFQNALHVGKRVRTETKISHGAMSHSQAVIEIIKQDQIKLSKAKILILGVSNVNMDVVNYLVKKGNQTIFMANRTYDKVMALSKKLNCKALKLEKIYEKIRNIDIIISATTAPHTILKKDRFIGTGQKITIFDLAVPRDVDPEIEAYEDVTLYNVEDIEKRININRKERYKEIEIAEGIIKEEININYD
jgi:glutamyl-tRNA reductase